MVVDQAFGYCSTKLDSIACRDLSQCPDGFSNAAKKDSRCLLNDLKLAKTFGNR